MVKRIVEQAEVRRRDLASKPLLSQEEVMKYNFQQGIVAGMLLAIQLPERLMELDREAFNQYLENQRDVS